MIGPKSLFCQDLHRVKYRQKGETFDDYCIRYARTTCDNEKHFRRLLHCLRTQAILPAGRQQRAVGWPHQTTAFNCLSGDTPVLTREYGEVPISTVSGMSVTLCDGNGQWCLSRVESFGVQTTYPVTFRLPGRSLEVRATAKHAWIVNNDRVDTDALRPGDAIEFRVPISSGTINPLEVPPYTRVPTNQEDYRKGVVHGFVYGDGTTQGKGFQVRVCSGKEDMHHYLDLEKHPYSTPPSSDGNRHYYFFGDGVCNFKALPDVGRVTDDYLLGFVRGWVAADGCVSDQPEVLISVGGEEKDWLGRYGPIIGFNVVGATILPMVTNYGARNKVLYNVRLDRRHLSKEDFIRSKHRERFEGVGSKNWKVSEVDLRSPVREEVYCAIVGTTHSFVLSGGILSGNCFVGGTIPDDTKGIGNALTESMLTLRSGGGCGWDFSPLRPAGTPVRGLGDDAYASGPISFMGMWHAMCSTIRSAGERRGAMMGVLAVNHPDIMTFIRAKEDERSLTNFNISVGITDGFMEAVENDKLFTLEWGGTKYQDVRALDLWSMIMQNNWDWAEPGVLFLDTINRMNPLRYCETIRATNPCSEQPLPPNGACLLLSHNLVKYVTPVSYTIKGKGYSPVFGIDTDRLAHDVDISVRACDNVFEHTIFPLESYRQEALNKRRMGIGVTGMANALEVCGYRYASPEYLQMQEEILNVIKVQAYTTSIDMAKVKGPFPLFDANKWLDSGFAQTLPGELRYDIRKHGLRNGLLLSIAPTGTISLTADNVSSGIEPPYAMSVDRTVNMADGPTKVVLNDYALEEYGMCGRTASETSPEEHVDVLCSAQKHVDSSISKTINFKGYGGVGEVASDETTFAEFKDLYTRAYRGGAKGCSSFNSNGKRRGILQEVATGERCIITESGAKICD